ncbi:MAG TPA: hypothetical protein VF230_08780, partial [Acidimicrobiales bacterium]
HDGAMAEEYRDELPEDLDASGYVGPYTFPDNARRRVPGILYVVAGLALLGTWFAAGDAAVLVNRGTAVAGVALVAIGVYSILAGYPLAFDETRALAAAGRKVGFAVGHASAQLGWRGLRSRPTWRILLYSADEPPTQRGLVLIDAVDGSVVDAIVEANPEDWSQFTDA